MLQFLWQCKAGWREFFLALNRLQFIDLKAHASLIMVSVLVYKNKTTDKNNQHMVEQSTYSNYIMESFYDSFLCYSSTCSLRVKVIFLTKNLNSATLS